jgi:hypothetical protein
MLEMVRSGGGESLVGMSLMELLQHSIASKSKLRAAKGEAELMKGKASILGSQAMVAQAEAAQMQAEAAMKNASNLSPHTEQELFGGSNKKQGTEQQKQTGNLPPPPPGNQSGPGTESRGNVFGNPRLGSGDNQGTPGNVNQPQGGGFHTYVGPGGVIGITNNNSSIPPGATGITPDSGASASRAGQVAQGLKHLQKEEDAWNAYAGDSGKNTAAGSGQPVAKAEDTKPQTPQPTQKEDSNANIAQEDNEEEKKVR